MGKAIVDRRRDIREPVEMLAHLRHDALTSTVVLRDMTPRGARVDGFAELAEDESVDLFLPGMKPIIAFVIWANEHCAGLEFADSLHPVLFAELVRTYGLNQQDSQSRSSEDLLRPDAGPLPVSAV
jgi:hypothetical protein